jgi:DNA segregation ATPase FtsK/SpoIIIE, S-DNA-T family
VTLVVRHSARGAVATHAAPPLPSPLRRPLAYWESVRWERRRQARLRAQQQARAWQLQDVLIGLGLFDYGHGSIANPGRTVLAPRVVELDNGPPPTFTVQALPAQLLSDYQQHAATLAEVLGGARVRITAVGGIGHGVPDACGRGLLLRIEVFEVDPLDELVPLPAQVLSGPDELLLLGVDDAGVSYRVTPRDLVHLAVQGATGSGKSVFVYGLLAQILGTDQVLVAISDPSGLLTRPFTGTVHAPWQVAGTSDPDAHVRLLERLVCEMDERIATLPPRADQVQVSDGCPLIALVLEEYPGLLRALDDGRKAGGRIETVKRLVGRLIAEGRKAGIRLLILANRFEAAVVDGFTRDQCTVKISFRVGNGDSIAMLHPTGRLEAEQHATAPPGVALLTGPGVPLARIKSPYIGTPDGDTAYSAYWDLVTQRAARLPA